MPGPLFRGWWQPGKRMFFVVSKMGTWGNIFSPVYNFPSAREETFVRTGEIFRGGALLVSLSRSGGGGEVEGKGRLQAVAEGVACGGEAGQEGLGLLYQPQQAAAKGRGTEGEPGMGFQLQEAQLGFGLQGVDGSSLGVVFRRVAAVAACGREGLMPGPEGFPFHLQGFQQVEEALLGFQGVGIGSRT